jgi:valyl-tRNA synthetase
VYVFSAKKEAKRAEKLAKLAAKNVQQAKPAAVGGSKEKKVKQEKPKEEEEEFVNTTPKGQKKGESDLYPG